MLLESLVLTATVTATVGSGIRKSELDEEPRLKCLVSWPNAGDPVDTIATQLIAIVHYKQKDVAFLGPTQRVRFDASGPPSPAFPPLTPPPPPPVLTPLPHQSPDNH